MEIKNVAILGAGTMGSGIAQVLANSGFRVSLWSRQSENYHNRLRQEFKKPLYRKFLNASKIDLLLSRINFESSLSDVVVEAELVIESVIEDLSIKKAIFKKIDSCCTREAILASNTSSLSINSLAEVTNRPEKVIGTHFFNPVHVMKLVEVAQGSLTSQETIGDIVRFLKKLDKIPLIVRDSPGFVVNRCLMPMINQAAFILMDKTATAETIDSAMKLGANHPLGPLALADLIGIDVCVKIMRELQNGIEFSEYTVCPLLEKMVAEGTLGRKTGKGFFSY